VTAPYPVAWVCVIIFALTVYVSCDGLDLGVGVLLPFTSDEDERARMVISIAPIWDGNETWIVLTGVGLFGGFPVAYGIILPALYIPLFAMLLALAFRGVAFEFRFQSPKPKLWDASFAVGSIVAAFAQGVVLGNLIHGFDVVGDTFAGSPLAAFNPFAIFTGFVVVIAYAALGAAWLVRKTDGPLAARARRQCRVLLAAFAVALGAGTTDLRVPSIIGCVICVGFLIAAIIAVGSRSEESPLRLTLAAVVSGTLSVGLTLFPYLVRPAITIWSANTPSNAQRMLLIGAIVTIPVILAYQIFAFVVFRGKAVVPTETQP
jgi:cytochrome d ubiquinol oxidase subunit II